MNAGSIWHGDGLGARVARGVLSPLELAYRGVMAGRNALYSAGLLRTRETAVPALSVGNLSVGGTGKTPVAAHLARELESRGARPALVLRGYGGDEARVHALLNPDIPVLTMSDRVRATEEALAMGCDIAVFDDAFQHRRAARAADIVLVAAEQWSPRLRCLPAGPYREPAAALRRATLVLVTRKAASRARANEVCRELRRLATSDVGIVALHLGELRDASGGSGTSHPLAVLTGQRVLAVAGVGDPTAFALQLEGEGAHVTLAPYSDHHPFSSADAAKLASRGQAMDMIVCTLKDAVKLAPVWPRAGPSLWYVSQRVEVESGEQSLEAMFRQLLGARVFTVPTNPG